MTCLFYLLPFLTHKVLKSEKKKVHSMKDVAYYKYISEIRGSGANQDPIWYLFSFEEQTSKIYLAFSNNYRMTRCFLLMEQCRTTDRIWLEFTETSGNEFSFISEPLSQRMALNFHIYIIIAPQHRKPRDRELKL